MAGHRNRLTADHGEMAGAHEEIMQNNDVQLFDLRCDPNELQNLALQSEENQSIILRMNALLNDLMEKEIGVDYCQRVQELI